LIGYLYYLSGTSTQGKKDIQDFTKADFSAIQNKLYARWKKKGKSRAFDGRELPTERRWTRENEKCLNDK